MSAPKLPATFQRTTELPTTIATPWHGLLTGNCRIILLRRNHPLLGPPLITAGGFGGGLRLSVRPIYVRLIKAHMFIYVGAYLVCVYAARSVISFRDVIFDVGFV